jgi:hypothetical protein
VLVMLAMDVGRSKSAASTGSVQSGKHICDQVGPQPSPVEDVEKRNVACWEVVGTYGGRG